ncbi:hypothetical protein J2X65_001909 [Ancylobacter sp. 3268]|nr:hypothetical protein [Ancylobacter sp. 3268]
MHKRMARGVVTPFIRECHTLHFVMEFRLVSEAA